MSVFRGHHYTHTKQKSVDIKQPEIQKQQHTKCSIYNLRLSNANLYSKKKSIVIIH